MSSWLALTVAVGGLAFGIASVVLGAPLLGAMFAACGACQLVSAVLLARRRVAPGGFWGWSPHGQLLMASGFLAFGVMSLSHGPASRSLAWLIALVPAVVMIIGSRVERKARARQAVV